LDGLIYSLKNQILKSILFLGRLYWEFENFLNAPQNYITSFLHYTKGKGKGKAVPLQALGAQRVPKS